MHVETLPVDMAEVEKGETAEHAKATGVSYRFVDPRYGVVMTFGAAGWQSLAGNPDAAASFAEVGVVLTLLLTLAPSLDRFGEWLPENGVDWRTADPVLVFALTMIVTTLVTVIAFFLWV